MSEINLEQIINKAQKMGAREVELYYETSTDNDLEIYQGEVESLESAHSKGLGIRSFVDNKMGFAYTSDFTEQAITEAIKDSIDNAEITSSDENLVLPEKSEYQKLDIYNPALEEAKIEDKIDLALKMEETALEYDEKIDSVVEVNYSDNSTKIEILNSKGVSGSYQSNFCYAYLYVIAKSETDNQTGLALTYGKDLAELTPDKTANEAAENAIRLLDASSLKSQKAEVVLKPEVASTFLSLLGGAVSAQAVQKGRSVFADKLGEQIAADNVNIVDNPLLAEGIDNYPFDGEGVPAQKTEVVVNGVLKSYLYDSYTAKKAGEKSTGNAQRGGYRGIPDVGTSNFYLMPGDKSKEEIINGVKKGLYVHKVSGFHSGANPISGDFSVAASGEWIEDGEIKGAVSDVTIAGNIIDLLQGIVEIGDELEFNPITGSYASPIFKVDQLSISGE